jgi:hypothetical protein
MPRQLTHYSVRVLRGERVTLDCPVVIWRAPPQEMAAVPMKTLAHQKERRPTSVDPLVYELRKALHARNAFPMGITVGRAESNDLWVDDASVSRFHAYFLQATVRGKHGWCVVDAESLNGSYLNTYRLKPSKPELLSSGDTVRFGDVDLVFHEPASFEKLLGPVRGAKR